MIVRKLRLEKGLSQEQLAGMAGISTRTLQRIERGTKASPETLKCIAAALDAEFSSLRREQAMQTTPAAAAPELSEAEQDTIRYARDLRAFYTHAIQYAVVMAVLLFLNLLTSPESFWVVWPALGWGIGLAMHGFSVFDVIGRFDQKWERRQIEKRLKSRRNQG